MSLVRRNPVIRNPASSVQNHKFNSVLRTAMSHVNLLYYQQRLGSICPVAPCGHVHVLLRFDIKGFLTQWLINRTLQNRKLQSITIFRVSCHIRMFGTFICLTDPYHVFICWSKTRGKKGNKQKKCGISLFFTCILMLNSIK